MSCLAGISCWMPALEDAVFGFGVKGVTLEKLEALARKEASEQGSWDEGI